MLGRCLLSGCWVGREHLPDCHKFFCEALSLAVRRRPIFKGQIFRIFHEPLGKAVHFFHHSSPAGKKNAGQEGDSMRRRWMSAILALTMALALTACASKPAAPTAADFEVQPGEYRYQDVDIFFVETEKFLWRKVIIIPCWKMWLQN